VCYKTFAEADGACCEQKDEIEKELDADIANVMDAEYGRHSNDAAGATSRQDESRDAGMTSEVKEPSSTIFDYKETNESERIRCC